MTQHTPGMLMELAVDFGVESLRVGSYEARKEQLGNGRIEDMRCKREQARRRLKIEVYAVFSERDELLDALKLLCSRIEVDGATPLDSVEYSQARAAIAKVES